MLLDCSHLSKWFHLLYLSKASFLCAMSCSISATRLIQFKNISNAGFIFLLLQRYITCLPINIIWLTRSRQLLFSTPNDIFNSSKFSWILYVLSHLMTSFQKGNVYLQVVNKCAMVSSSSLQKVQLSIGRVDIYQRHRHRKRVIAWNLSCASIRITTWPVLAW